LSGGEKQRLGLIIALLLNRPILLLDEISSSLDEKLTKQTIDKVLKMTDKTVVLIAHDLEWQKQENIKIFNFKDKKWEL
jgi:putative ABC transport system ATP-binding protein